jgi:hypothetical protein
VKRSLPEDELVPRGREQLGGGHVVLIIVVLPPVSEERAP